MDWMQQKPNFAIAVIAAVAAILGGIITATLTPIAKFFFEFYLSERLRRRWEAKRVQNKYSAPLIRAADDLAACIDNWRYVNRERAVNWLSRSPENFEKIPSEGTYYYISTLFLLVQLIAWIEILKKGQQFLDLSTLTRTRRFNAFLNLIYAVLSSPQFTTETRQDVTPKDHWIYIHNLSGIGAAATQRDEAGELTSMSFAELCRVYQTNRNGEFALWMNEAEKLFVDLECNDNDL